jgi:sensor histidine kinase YesM
VEERALPTPTCPETWAEAVPGKILIIEVRDDGVGIDPARAAEILESKPEPGGVWRIGIANVQRRIRLHFGEPYGLAIEGEAGRYTLVRYLLPALRRKAEETGGLRV